MEAGQGSHTKGALRQGEGQEPVQEPGSGAYLKASEAALSRSFQWQHREVARMSSDMGADPGWLEGLREMDRWEGQRSRGPLPCLEVHTGQAGINVEKRSKRVTKPGLCLAPSPLLPPSSLWSENYTAYG